MAGAPIVADTVLQLRRQGEAFVVLDLDELSFIDMSGLRSVLTAIRDAARDGWTLEITRGSRHVRRLITLAELDGRLPIHGASR